MSEYTRIIACICFTIIINALISFWIYLKICQEIDLAIKDIKHDMIISFDSIIKRINRNKENNRNEG